VEPNLRQALELFSQGIRQGSLLTRSGNAQNFSGSRKPFIGSDPVPVNQGRTPIPPSFRPNPVSPGQLGLFDIRATPSPSAPVVPNQNPGGSLDRYGAIARYGALATQEPPGQLATINKTPGGSLLPTSRDLRIFLQDIGPNGTSTLGRASVGAGLVGAARSSYLGSVQRNQLGGLLSPEGAAYSVAQGFTGGPTSILPLMVSGIQKLSKNLPDAQRLEDYARIKARDQEFNTNRTDAGRYVPGSQQRSIPENLTDAQRLESYARIKARDQEFNTNRTDAGRYMPGSQQQAVINQNPLPQTTPTDNTMTPASAAFTRFFVDDANRLSPTAMELATATGGVQTRDLGSLTSGLKAADLESVLNSVASAQAMSDSPSFMAGNPLMGTPKLMLSGAREQAVNEQKQQYAKQGAPKGITNEQRDYVLTMQAQQAAGKVLLPEILKNLGYSPQDPATRDLAVWAESNPGLALAVYNKQLEQNLNNRSDFPSPRELSSSDQVNQQSASNVEGTMVNSPMGANLARNAVANSHFNANAYVSGSQEATELADATQPLVQPTLQTAEQFIDQAPERAEATAQISDEMLKRAMELKLGKMSMDPSLLGN
jgi:hypothetical protein